MSRITRRTILFIVRVDDFAGLERRRTIRMVHNAMKRSNGIKYAANDVNLTVFHHPATITLLHLFILLIPSTENDTAESLQCFMLVYNLLT